jgi:hypothetical protein
MHDCKDCMRLRVFHLVPFPGAHLKKREMFMILENPYLSAALANTYGTDGSGLPDLPRGDAKFSL